MTETITFTPIGIYERRKPLMPHIAPSSRPFVMKFGGTSMGSAQAIDQVATILTEHYYADNPIVAVVSAMSGVTNRLVELCDSLERNHEDEREQALRLLFDRHMTAISQMRLSYAKRALLKRETRLLYLSLREIAEDGQLLSDAKRANIMRFGEPISARMLSYRLEDLGIPSRAIDATELIETDDNYLEATPDLIRTSDKAAKVLKPLLKRGVLPVVTGFMSATADGVPTILGRGGSDYTASILGRVLEAEEVWVWTDVDGIHTADPNKDPGAHVILKMSFDLADQMAKAGAKVLYPKTVEPLTDTNVVLRVKNTFRPHIQGTEISNYRLV